MKTAIVQATAIKRFHHLVQTGRLGERREAVGLTQGELARAVGVAPSTVWRWEMAKRRPRPHHAVAVLELLDD